MAVPVLESIGAVGRFENATSVTLAKPTGLAVGDLSLVIVFDDTHQNGTFWSAKTGWTKAFEIGDSTADAHMAVYWRETDGTEAANEVFSRSQADHGWGVWLRVSGANTTAPIDGPGSTWSNAGATSHVIPGFTTSEDDVLAFYALAFDGGDGQPFGQPTGWTEQTEDNCGTTTGNHSSGVFGTKAMATAGGTGNATVSSNVSDGGIGNQFGIKATSGQTVTIGLATETDTAQPVTSAKTQSIGLASETDTAQALTALKAQAIGLATETDTAQPVTWSKAVTLGLATETDTAQAVTALKTATIGLATETDTAQAVALGGQVVTIGLASETDTAQPLSSAKTQAIAQAIETDTAQAVTARESVLIGLASETDTAQALTWSKAQTIGQAVETDTAQALTGAKTQSIGLATETDTAQPVTASAAQIVLIGQAVETDTAQPVTSAKTVTIGLATETDTASAVGVERTYAIGQSVETDTAQPLAWSKAQTIGQATETDTAQPVTVVGGVPEATASTEANLRVTLDPSNTYADLDGSLTTVILDAPRVFTELVSSQTEA